MNGISLFTGSAIGELVFKEIIPGYRTVGYVENDPYCIAHIIKSIKAGLIDDAPIWDDIRTFDGKAWAGKVDFVSGGDPCQDNSNACRSHGACQRSLADEFLRVISEIRPHIILRENPSTVRSDAPSKSDRFANELRKFGYVTARIKINACCMGADHRRSRLFVFATLQDTIGKRLEGNVCKKMEIAREWRSNADTTGSNRWHTPPRICGKTDGVPFRVDRIKMLGNGWVPQTVARILKVRAM